LGFGLGLLSLGGELLDGDTELIEASLWEALSEATERGHRADYGRDTGEAVESVLTLGARLHCAPTHSGTSPSQISTETLHLSGTWLGFTDGSRRATIGRWGPTI